MRWFLAVLGLTVVVGAGPAHATDVPVPVWKSYRHAMVDSMRTDRTEVVQNLVRLTRSDPRVTWKMIDGRRYVLLATMRRDALSTEPSFKLASSKWATVPRQVRNRCARVHCRAMSDAELDLTFKQFLGAPPDGDYQVVNTFWARPRDIFRPCRLPSVRTSTCPRRAQGPLPTVDGISVRTFLKDQGTYAWRMPARFDAATSVSCASAYPEPPNCYGFPWTRLGYTYDWGPGRSEVGLTEFVVAKGARIQMQAVSSQRAFVRDLFKGVS